MSYSTACVLKGANIYKSFDAANEACLKDPLCEGFHDNCGLKRAFATCNTPIETVDPGKDCNTILYRKGMHYKLFQSSIATYISFLRYLNKFQ